MNKTAYILLATGLVLVAGIATAAPLVYLDPASLDICEGEFTVDVVVNEEVTDLTGFDLLIDFDETVLGVVDVAMGQLLADYPGSPFFYWTDAGTVSDALLINGAALGGSLDGPGVLATITFSCLANGLTDLEFAMVEFRDIDNLPLPVTSEDGVVNVDDDAVVYIDPASMTEAVDTPFTVEVMIGDGIIYMDELTLVITYDQTVLEYMTAWVGGDVPAGSTFIESGGAGTIDIDLDVNVSMSGVGSVAVLQFKGIFEGTSPITLDSVALGTETGTEVQPCVEDGSVTIYGGSPVEELRWGMIKSLYR